MQGERTILPLLMMARSSRPFGPNNICDATKADETDNDGIEPLLTLAKGDRGRDSKGWVSQTAIRPTTTVWYVRWRDVHTTQLQQLRTQLINAPTNQGTGGQRFDGQIAE